MKHRCACLGDPDEMAAARQAEISDRGKFVTLELTPVPKNTLTQCVCAEPAVQTVSMTGGPPKVHSIMAHRARAGNRRQRREIDGGQSSYLCV